MKILFFLLIFPLLIVQAYAQKASMEQLISQYRKSNADTNRVRLLLTLDTIYLYRLPDTDNILDSAILLAKDARSLSEELHFEPGIYEASFLLANAYAEKKDMVAAQAVANAASGFLQVHMLIMLGERYLYRPGDLKQNLDSAYYFASRARAASETLHSNTWLYESLCLLAKYYFVIGEPDKARSCFMRMINDFHAGGNVEREAFWWSELGNFMPDSDSAYKEEILIFDTAFKLYQRIGKKSSTRNMITNIAYLHERHKNLTLAEEGYTRALKMTVEMGDTVLFGQLSGLSQLNLAKGNYDKSLYYALRAVDNVHSYSNTNQKGYVYYNLAEAYRALGETDKSLQWYLAALDNLVGSKEQFFFPIAGHIVDGMILKGQVREALNFIEQFTRNNEPVRFSDREIAAAAKAACFNALKQFDKAEAYYLQMIRFDKLAADHLKNNISSEYMGSGMNSSDAYYAVGRFYAERGQYTLAENYLQQALTAGIFSPILSQLSNIHYMLFKVDSAQGKYIAAINEFQLHKQLNDSIFNEVKSRTIEELNIRYDTKKKEQDLRMSQANETLQLKAIKDSAQSRRFAYLLVGLLIVLVGVLYRLFVVKQKSNRLLQDKQQRINSQNGVLSELNLAQQKLLSEKEWLVREIHHRVKNNLQIVISLLNTQASHLQEGDARMAIQESRHRMQVISLLHQRLYQVETSSMVDMQVYIREVVAYLKESFRSINHLYFSVQTDSVTLDISQAVPVGLILNEAITNSIKYAFPDGEPGRIAVSLHRQADGSLLLSVADNGIGLQKSIEPAHSDSLGIQLMQTLSEQLDGSMTLRSREGTTVEIRFGQQGMEQLPDASSLTKHTAGNYA